MQRTERSHAPRNKEGAEGPDRPGAHATRTTPGPKSNPVGPAVEDAPSLRLLPRLEPPPAAAVARLRRRELREELERLPVQAHLWVGGLAFGLDLGDELLELLAGDPLRYGRLGLGVSRELGVPLEPGPDADPETVRRVRAALERLGRALGRAPVAASGRAGA